jgi:competence protein ComEC
MPAHPNYFWKKAPFIKFLLAMMAGILVQWYFPAPGEKWIILFIAGLLALCFHFFIPYFQRFRFAFLNGVITAIVFFAFGASMSWKKDIRNHPHWLGHLYSPPDGMVVTLEEHPVDKTRSLKAIATPSYLLKNDSLVPVKGKIIIYFSKDDTTGLNATLSYGSRILFNKTLQEIKNAGNPGGFDYKRYALFQGITHQVYLAGGAFEILTGKNESALKKFIYASKEKLLQVIRTYIPGGREAGLAEALLIGYKHDLDQSLVQSYTNTGVVHIIAISGLHLGLIYWLLALLLKPLQKRKKTRWIRTVLIIACLWMFSLVAGAQPSILRSALMFTCIVLGESLSRKTSIYNTMAVSAFILLCINPYWIWDVGFQLSYAAVLSIIIFMRPIYNLFYIKNKALDFIWKMNAVTLAAQVLTVPLSIYHFPQFPILFLLTNFLAVPLSSAILLGEILLCVVSFAPAPAVLIGKILSWLISVMNTYIERIESIPFSLWHGLQINVTQSILLYIFIGAIAYWLLENARSNLKWGLAALLLFTGIRSLSFIQTTRQQKIIVYNVPKKTAIDIINGRDHSFLGDSGLLGDNFAGNFHLRPSRVMQRLKKPARVNIPNHYGHAFNFHGKHILLVDRTVDFVKEEKKLPIDLLIISKNPKLYLDKLAAALDIKQVVFDSSVPDWRKKFWKKDCDSLSIPWYDVSTKGAFVMSIR